MDDKSAQIIPLMTPHHADFLAARKHARLRRRMIESCRDRNKQLAAMTVKTRDLHQSHPDLTGDKM